MNYFKNRRFLLDFSEELRRERPLLNNFEVSDELMRKIVLMEEMSKIQGSVYSLFDFLKGEYLFHTRNFQVLTGYISELPLGKIKDIYTLFVPERRTVDKYIDLVRKVFALLDEEEKTELRTAVVGGVLENLNHTKFRCCYIARPLTFDPNGNVEISFDSLSDVQSLLAKEPGFWIRFSTPKRVFHWHSHSNRFVPKEIVLRRELEILLLWKKGLTIPEIARALELSVFTVKNQLANLRKRLLVRDNTSAIQLCLRTGIIKDSLGFQ
ncbi:MAG: LuxR C-terminal-related transcriptional regulator [Leadbetterella sp.]|nr:LuxR C-terminal-related transcriptional regulator [Leadbetterella sp.]